MNLALPQRPKKYFRVQVLVDRNVVVGKKFGRFRRRF